jgi:tRNA-dihydrouridine synthase B
MCRRHGCAFAFFEMLDANGLTYGHKKTLGMIRTVPEDAPIGAQVLGADPDMVLEACHIILTSSKPLLIDLNFACPAKKVLKKKAGAYMLKEPQKAGKIVKKLASSLSLPVTVKIRQGYAKEDTSSGLKLARICQDNGASAVFIHGRTAAQGYSGRVNYNSIAEIKKVLKIPVFGSGDVFTPELAKKMLDETGCDGVLIARGAMGNPWIFKQTEAFLKDGTHASPLSYEEIISTAKEHLQLFKEYKHGLEKYYIGHMRKIAMWYTKGMPYSKRARESLMCAQTYVELLGILDRLNSNYDEEWLKR